MDFREHADFPTYLARGREAARAGGYSGDEADDVAEDFAIGAMAERERICTILTSRAAADRTKTARHLALTTDMPAGAVISLLATLPADTPTISGRRSSTSPIGLVVDHASGAASSKAPDTAAIYAKRAAEARSYGSGRAPESPAPGAATLPNPADVYAARRRG